MQTVDEKPETIHLFVVREAEIKPRIYPIVLSVLALASLVALSTVVPYRQPVTRAVIRVPAVPLPLKTFTAQIAIIPTGVKVYPAIAAHGVLSITNGSIIGQSIPAGFTIQGVETDSAVYVPPGNANVYGWVQVQAHTLVAGRGGNLPAYSVNSVIGSSVYIRNLRAFSGGRDSYSVKYATAQDNQLALTNAREQLMLITSGLHYPCTEIVSVKVAILFEEMEHYGCILHSVKEVIDDTPMGRFARMVLAFFGEMEREKILDRTLTGRVNAAKNGKVVSGVKALYGWQWVFDDKGERDHLILHDEQATVLQRAAEEYAVGDSLYTIIERFTREGIAPPKGDVWHVRTLRRILVDARMTGQNITIFNVKNKRAKQHLDPVELPEGTYPRILSDELYQQVLDRAATNAALATRNSRTPERYLLRAGFVRCAYCGYVMTSKSFVNHGYEYLVYMCPNNNTDCKHFTVPSDKLDEAVWAKISVLADHITLLEQSIEFAIQDKSVDEDLRAIDATLIEWKQKVANYEDDLGDTNLRGDTRIGIRNLLDKANAMVEKLESDRNELIVFTVDRDKEREEYEKVLAWCKRVKQDGEEMPYTMKRDFLRLLGAYVIVERIERRGVMPKWDIKVRLPQVEEIIYQGSTFRQTATPLCASCSTSVINCCL